LTKEVMIEGKEMYDSQLQQYLEIVNSPFCWSLVDPHFYIAIGDVKGKSIIDFACGQGTQSFYVYDHGATDVVGVDISSELIKIAQKDAGDRKITFVEDDIRNPGLVQILGENRFDIAFSVWGVCYMEGIESVRAFFTNAFKLLAPGGKAMFYNMDNDVALANGIDKITLLDYHLLDGNVGEGARIKCLIGTKKFESLECTYPYSSMERLMKEVGFQSIIRHDTYNDAEGVKGYGEENWKVIQKHKPFYVIIGTKE